MDVLYMFPNHMSIEKLFGCYFLSKSGFDINELVQEAQNRWLKPVEVLFILQNHESHQITQEPPQKPLGDLHIFP